MSIITCYKSDADGKLFEDKKKYQAHLRKLARERNAKRKVAKMEAEREAFMDLMGQVKSIDELNQFIKDNWKWFWANGAQREHFMWGRKGTPNFHEYVDVTIAQVHWGEKISNSHSRPRKGVENFNNNVNKPTGYPGWVGRITIKVKPPMYKYRGKEYMNDGWGSSYFERTIIHTGTGGGGRGKDCKEYSYDVKLFAADFPVMYEMVRREQWLHRENEERQHVWRTLGGQGTFTQVTEIPEDWQLPDPMICDENARQTY